MKTISAANKASTARTALGQRRAVSRWGCCMRKVKPTQKDLAYIWEGFNSTASAEVAASKLAFCVRGYKAHARDVWQDTQAYRRHHTEMARECLIDARYWQAALVKYAA